MRENIKITAKVLCKTNKPIDGLKQIAYKYWREVINETE